MIAIDTNILVYAHRQDAPFHTEAYRCLASLMDSVQPWTIPWPCVHEFISTVTRSIFRPPSNLAQAFGAIDAWSEGGAESLIGEGKDHLNRLRQLAEQGRVVGPQIHDARIAAICLAHGVRELWSADRDFSRYPDLNVINPLVA